MREGRGSAKEASLCSESRGQKEVWSLRTGSCGAVGRYSRDGRQWTQASTPPYDCTIRFTEASGGGSAVATGCGNRPQIHFGENGDPEILINGANAAQPGTPNHFNTWTLFRPLSQLRH